MILTRMYLNPRRRGARKLIGSPQAMHAAVLSGFPPGLNMGRPLWRLDMDDPLRPTLYVLSENRPDVTHIEEQAGWPTQPTAQFASYDHLLDGLRAGDTWCFRLKANPTHRAQIAGRSKIVAHVTVSQQKSWLQDREPSLGISLGAESPTFDLIDREVLRFRRDGKAVTLGTATFQGQLKVVDPETFRQALVSGIGRGKAYGCGLLTLAKA